MIGIATGLLVNWLYRVSRWGTESVQINLSVIHTLKRQEHHFLYKVMHFTADSSLDYQSTLSAASHIQDTHIDLLKEKQTSK